MIPKSTNHGESDDLNDDSIVQRFVERFCEDLGDTIICALSQIDVRILELVIAGAHKEDDALAGSASTKVSRVSR